MFTLSCLFTLCLVLCLCLLFVYSFCLCLLFKFTLCLCPLTDLDLLWPLDLILIFHDFHLTFLDLPSPPSSAHLPWFSFLKRSLIWLKSGLISGCSAQHCFMTLMASGGAAPFDTDGRIIGGGFLRRAMISEARKREELGISFITVGRYFMGDKGKGYIEIQKMPVTKLHSPFEAINLTSISTISFNTTRRSLRALY